MASEPPDQGGNKTAPNSKRTSKPRHESQPGNKSNPSSGLMSVPPPPLPSLQQQQQQNHDTPNRKQKPPRIQQQSNHRHPPNNAKQDDTPPPAPLSLDALQQTSAEALRKNQKSLTEMRSATEEICLLCCEPIQFVGLGECEHKTCCSTCTLRLRLQHKDNRCAVCKTPMETVYILVSRDPRSHVVLSSQTWGKVCPGFTYDEGSCCFVSDMNHLKFLQTLREARCKECHQLFPSRLALTMHLDKSHQRYLCDLCVEHRGLFLMEVPQFSRAELTRHYRTGDGPLSGFGGHPSCRFCAGHGGNVTASTSSFYSNDELYKHMQTAHEKCHLCARSGSLYHYYKDYAALQAHFESDHFACSDPACRETRFVVFENDIALQTHMATQHGNRTVRPALVLDFVVRGSHRERHHRAVMDDDAEFNNEGETSRRTTPTVTTTTNAPLQQQQQQQQPVMEEPPLGTEQFPPLPGAKPRLVFSGKSSNRFANITAPQSSSVRGGSGTSAATPRDLFTTHTERQNIELLSKSLQSGNMDEHEFYLTLRELVGPVALGAIFSDVVATVLDPTLQAKLWSVHENFAPAPIPAPQRTPYPLMPTSQASSSSSRHHPLNTQDSSAFPALSQVVTPTPPTQVRGARRNQDWKNPPRISKPIDPSRFLGPEELARQIGRGGNGHANEEDTTVSSARKKKSNGRKDKDLARLVFGGGGGG